MRLGEEGGEVARLDPVEESIADEVLDGVRLDRDAAAAFTALTIAGPTPLLPMLVSAA